MTARRVISAVLAVGLCVFCAGEAQGTIVVNGWTLIDDSFGNDANGTFALTTVDTTWGATGTEPNDWANNFRWNAKGAGNDKATWTFLNLPNGTYQVAVSYGTPHAGNNRATDSPYSINGGPAVLVNQETVAAGIPTLFDGSNNIPFDTISTNTMVTGGTLSVVLTDAANEYVIADAVAIRMPTPLPPGTVIIDQNEPGFTVSGGTFVEQGAVGDAYDGDHAWNQSQSPADVGTYLFTGLAGGQYDVYATWRQNGQGNVGLADYLVSDGGGLATVNQFNGPANDLVLNTYNFEKLATATVADGNLQVDLNAAGNNFILADAVAIVPVTVIPEPMTMLAVGTALTGLGGYIRRRRRA